MPTADPHAAEQRLADLLERMTAELRGPAARYRRPGPAISGAVGRTSRIVGRRAGGRRHRRRFVASQLAIGSANRRSIGSRSHLDRSASDIRRLRTARRTRPRRDGCGLPGPAAQSRPRGRLEDDFAGRLSFGRRPGALSIGGRVGGAARPPAYRAGLRSRRSRRAALLRDEIRRRHHARRAAGRGAAAAARSRRDSGADLRRDPLRPQPRHFAPRSQAVEHSDRPRRPPACHRFRPGQARDRRFANHALRCHPWHALLHGARAGRRQSRAARPGQRRLQPGYDPLPDAHRPAPLSGRDGGRHGAVGARARSAAAAAVEPAGRPRPGNDRAASACKSRPPCAIRRPRRSATICGPT